jgi:hypothetical protein
VLKISVELFDHLKIDLPMVKDVVKALNHSADATFAHHSYLSFQCTGGHPALLGTAAAPKADSWKPWLRSVGLAPAPIERSKRLRPISDFVAEAAGRAALHGAIAEHLNGPAPAPVDSESRSSAPVATASAAAATAAAAAETPATHGSGSAAGDRAEQTKGEKTRAATLAVPGVCSGWGDVGVGCGFDATMMEAYGMTINPKKPVIKMPACPARCYADPDDQSADCEYCTYSNPFNTAVSYKVPSNIFVEDTPESGGCFESTASAHVDDYTKNTETKTGHHGFFHSHSKTVKKFYHQYFQQDQSLSLQLKYVLYHTVNLVDLVPKPSDEIRLATLLLPKEYDPEKYVECGGVRSDVVYLKSYVYFVCMRLPPPPLPLHLTPPVPPAPLPPPCPSPATQLVSTN